MTRDEHERTALMGGSAFQETGMDDYLTRVAEAVRDACFEACNENGGDMGAICGIDMPAIIASVPRPEPDFYVLIDGEDVEFNGHDEFSCGRTGGRPLYAEPVAAQVAVPEQWQAVARECVSHIDDGRTQPALSRSLRKLSAMLDSSVAPPVAVPDGWKMVPVEPTIAMCIAGDSARLNVDDKTRTPPIYRAMLAAAPEAPQAPQTAAASDVLAERQRQVSIEGWTPEHDDAHGDGELSQAAACYAMRAHSPERIKQILGPNDWPWDKSWWKPSADQRRNLVKAGALILTEIERLDRAAIASAKGDAAC